MERKVALVTGAGSGIGRGVALELGKAGYDVAVHYASSESGALETRDALRKLGVRAEIMRADLSSVAGVDELYRQFDALFSRLDACVANAGLTLKAPFLEISEENFDKICSLDFKGTLFTCQRAARRMADKRIEGSLVVISSNHHAAQFAECTVYGCVKTALVKFVKHAGVELARYGIRANAVAPGWTDTGAARLDAKESTYYKIPLKRWCTPEEIGQSVVYLCSDAARCITGACLTIDSGAILQCDTAEKYGL